MTHRNLQHWSLCILLLFSGVFVGCEVPEVDEPSRRSSSVQERASGGVSLRELESATNEVIRLRDTITSKLSEVNDEQSSRVRAAELQGLFDEHLTATQELTQLGLSASTDQLKEWRSSPNNLRQKLKNAEIGLGKEISRISRIPSVPASFKLALALEIKELQLTLNQIKNDKLQASRGRSTGSSSSSRASSANNGSTVEVTFRNAPLGSHNAIMQSVWKGVSKHLSGSTRRCSYSPHRREVTVYVPGVDDIKAVAEMINLGDVIEIDESANTITIDLDPSKLPDGWEEEAAAEQEEQRRREEYFEDRRRNMRRGFDRDTQIDEMRERMRERRENWDEGSF